MAHSLRRKFSCPVELALEIVGGKWKPVILAHLKQGALRYSELRSLVPSLSDKVLSQRLKDLEELELVQRQPSGRGGGPARYELTVRGRSLRPVLQALYDWGELVAPDVGAVIETTRPTPARAAQRR